MREQSVGRVVSPFLGIASVVTAATVFGYTRLLEQQGSWPGIDSRITLILGLLCGTAILGGVATFATSRAFRAYAAAACAGVLLPLGLLALFSIGLPLMAAGGLAVAAWVTAVGNSASRHATLMSVAVGIAALLVLATGLVATSSGS